MGKQLLLGSPFHAGAHIHDHDLVGNVLHNAEVMGDEHVGQTSFVLQIHQQIQNLGLNGHVQSGDRLIADDEFRVQGQCPRHADPLTAAAVQLMGIGMGQTLGQAHGVHQLFDPLVQARLVTRVHIVDEHGLCDQLPDGHTGIQAGVWILEDHLHLRAHMVHLGLIHGHEVPALVKDLAGRRLLQAQHGAAQGGLAAAGLTHHAQGLALFDLQVDAVHRVEKPLGGLEILL